MSVRTEFNLRAASVDEAMEGGGFWRSCSGCHEAEDGHETGHYSRVLKCYPGSGCHECGGLGAVWDQGISEADLAMMLDGALADDFDLIGHLNRQRAFSLRTFGPGVRTKGVLDHIRKELAEIEADPLDIKEWVDVIILAFDGALRTGWEPVDIVQAIVEKQTRNEARKWPDWRTADPNKAIEHDRTGEVRS